MSRDPDVELLAIEHMLAGMGLSFYRARQFIARLYATHCKQDNVPDAVAIGHVHQKLVEARGEKHPDNCQVCPKVEGW